MEVIAGLKASYRPFKEGLATRQGGGRAGPTGLGGSDERNGSHVAEAERIKERLRGPMGCQVPESCGVISEIGMDR